MRGLKKVWKKSKGDFLLNALIVLFCISSVFPIYWMLTSSIKYTNDIIKIPPDWIPTRTTFANFINIFEAKPVWRWLYNSFFISFVGTFLVVIVSCLTAFAISKLEFKGKKILFYFVVAALVLPKEVYILPLYKIMIALGLRGTLIGIILPDIAMPFGVFLMIQFYDNLPDEIMEAAEIDGCGKLTFFLKFALPLSAPGIAALGILSFVRLWNGYLWQMVMADGINMYTIPVGVASLFTDNTIIDYGVKFAGATLTAVPLLIVFIIFQKYFTAGITAGSVKG